MGMIADMLKEQMGAPKVKGAIVIKKESGDGGAGSPVEDAIGDAFDAIKGDDKEAFVSAIRAALDLCENEESEGDEPDEIDAG